MTCSARVVGQQYHCYRCEYTWDLGDDDPPQCMNLQEYGNMHLKKMKDMVKPRYQVEYLDRKVRNKMNFPAGWFIWDTKEGKAVSDVYIDKSMAEERCEELNAK